MSDSDDGPARSGTSTRACGSATQKRSACGGLTLWLPVGQEGGAWGKAAECALWRLWYRQRGLKRVLNEKKLLLVLDLDHTLLNSTRFEEVSLASRS